MTLLKGLHAWLNFTMTLQEITARYPGAQKEFTNVLRAEAEDSLDNKSPQDINKDNDLCTTYSLSDKCKDTENINHDEDCTEDGMKCAGRGPEDSGGMDMMQKQRPTACCTCSQTKWNCNESFSQLANEAEAKRNPLSQAAKQEQAAATAAQWRQRGQFIRTWGLRAAELILPVAAGRIFGDEVYKFLVYPASRRSHDINTQQAQCSNYQNLICDICQQYEKKSSGDRIVKHGESCNPPAASSAREMSCAGFKSNDWKLYRCGCESKQGSTWNCTNVLEAM